MLEAQLLLICRGTDEEGQLYGFAVASGKRYVEQRKLFMQYLANTKNKFDEIIGDEASLICNKVYLKHSKQQSCGKTIASRESLGEVLPGLAWQYFNCNCVFMEPGCFVFAQLCAVHSLINA